MPHNDEYFSPEQIDEQLNQLAQQANTQEPMNELIETLHHIYQPQVTEEDRVSLNRVKQRLAERKAIQSQPAPAVNVINQRSHPAQKGAQMDIGIQLTTHKKQVMPILFNILAAAIIAGIMLSGWYLLMRVNGTPPINQPTPTQVIPGPTATATTKPQKQAYVYKILENTVSKLNTQTGNVLWQKTVTAQEPDTSNNTIKVVDNVVYVTLANALYALKASDGSTIWRVDTQYATNMDAIIQNDSIYIQHDDKSYSAYSTKSGQEKWHSPALNALQATFSVYNNTLYITYTDFSSNENMLVSLNAATGTTVWQRSLASGTIFSAAKVASNILYYATGNIVYALNAQTGQDLWQQAFPEAQLTITALEIEKTTLYVSTSSIGMQAPDCSVTKPECNTGVYALNAKTGKQLWQSANNIQRLNDSTIITKSNITEVIPVTNNRLITYTQETINTNEGVKHKLILQALDSQTGKLAWQLPTSIVTSNFDNLSGAIYANKLYVTVNERLLIIDLRTGADAGVHSFGQNQPLVAGFSNDILYIRLYKTDGSIQFQARKLVDPTSLIWETPSSTFTAQQPIIK